MKKIKVLKDTPFHKKDEVIDANTFGSYYNGAIIKPMKEWDIIQWLEKENKLEQENPRYGIGSWFQVVEDTSFKVGDWVWNELMKQALYIVEGNKYGKEWYPNMCTINAVNENPEICRRKATQEEIDFYNLESFCNEKVLIGQFCCYYFHNVWKPLVGISRNISTYINTVYFQDIGVLKQNSSETELTYNCRINGLKVGCTEISHEDILKIAKILKLM